MKTSIYVHGSASCPRCQKVFVLCLHGLLSYVYMHSCFRMVLPSPEKQQPIIQLSFCLMYCDCCKSKLHQPTTNRQNQMISISKFNTKTGLVRHQATKEKSSKFPAAIICGLWQIVRSMTSILYLKSHQLQYYLQKKDY